MAKLMIASTASAEHAADFNEYNIDDNKLFASAHQRSARVLHLSHSITTRYLCWLSDPAPAHAARDAARDTAAQAAIRDDTHESTGIRRYGRRDPG